MFTSAGTAHCHAPVLQVRRDVQALEALVEEHDVVSSRPAGLAAGHSGMVHSYAFTAPPQVQCH